MMNACASLLYISCLRAKSILIESEAPREYLVGMQNAIVHLDLEILGGDISQETIHNAESELIAANEWLEAQTQQKAQGAA
jgi:hypothetical protein